MTNKLHKWNKHEHRRFEKCYKNSYTNSESQTNKRHLCDVAAGARRAIRVQTKKGRRPLRVATADWRERGPVLPQRSKSRSVSSAASPRPKPDTPLALDVWLLTSTADVIGHDSSLSVLAITFSLHQIIFRYFYYYTFEFFYDNFIFFS